MRKPLSALALALAVVAAGPAALAQNPTGQCENTPNTPREQTFCFNAENVAGSLVGNTGQDVRALTRLRGPSLLRMRAHFVSEMLRSAENL